ncbi:MAG: glycine cleavage system aminomethyltransferase GcvT, partial [Phycisphaeraceae bacterium]|nr:glycine cleavage system aminomethyltransferase GcvT [Phycisphaeraceae bacterium]
RDAVMPVPMAVGSGSHTLLRTPFYDFHAAHQARFVDFAGWEMPILYTSIIEEHRHVRTSGGLFDVSHMGRLEFKGRYARRLLERALTRRVSDMEEGQCRYALVCNEAGGVLDDVIVSRMDERWLLVVNASNRKKIVRHLRELAGDQPVEIKDLTLGTAMVALQGPDVIRHLGPLADSVGKIKRYRFREYDIPGLKLMVSRTGYTGEDGIEVILSADHAPMAVNMIGKFNAKAREEGLPEARPIGLGARDTLRMEAGMPLYGHELSESIDPISAGLDFAINLDKDEDAQGEPFIGQDVLKRYQAKGSPKRLVGLKLEGRRSPRQGMAIQKAGQPIGEVTSGCLSPTLGFPIAMALIQPGAAEVGDTLEVALGRQPVPAEVVKLPFYKRPSKQT